MMTLFVLIVFFSVLSGLANRLGQTRYTMRGASGARRAWGLSGRNTAGASGLGSSSTVKLRGRHLLDYEALTCLLVLLFVDEPKLNTTRLHRVLRNLCYHGPTRTWIVRALLSMLQKTAVQQQQPVCDSNVEPSQAPPPSSAASSSSSAGGSRPPPGWLSISLDAALGCRANVFQMQRAAAVAAQHSTGKKTPVSAATSASAAAAAVTIHPQAAPIVCRHVLDTLIALAKIFPNHFLPQNNNSAKSKDTQQQSDSDTLDTISGSKTKEQVPPKTPNSKQESQKEADFWELLVKLDGIVTGKKGKGFHRAPSGNISTVNSEGNECNAVSSDAVNFDASPLGELMSMLAHPVLRRSQQLTDRLLRLLGLASMSLASSSQTSTTNTTTIASSQPTTTTTNAASKKNHLIFIAVVMTP